MEPKASPGGAPGNGGFSPVDRLLLGTLAALALVALPFVLLDDVRMALLVSRALTLAMLFAGGVLLARHAGYPAWKGGLALVGLGVALTLAIVALGG
jgi:VIT1/CCC1 family predicted Fe2+/Mn2+ transporter